MSTAPHTPEDLAKLLQRVEERERTARTRAIFYSLVPIIVAVVLLTVTGWQVYDAEKKVAAKKAELETYQKAILKLNVFRGPGGKAEGNAPGGIEPTQQSSQVNSITTEVNLRASAEEKGKVTANGSQLYNMRLWVEGSPKTLARIAAVQYEFNNPTFLQKIRESADRQGKFVIEYTGWGCLSSVIVTFKLVNPPPGPPAQTDFDMCAALGWS
jgi:hypothetical protein